MGAVGCRVNRPGGLAPDQRIFSACDKSESRERAIGDRRQLKATAVAVATLLIHANGLLMAQSAGAKPELARTDVTIEAAASGSDDSRGADCVEPAVAHAAIHEYVRPVLAETPNRAANRPGNNLGWDAPREPDVRK
jgi:hypothetical protein